MTLEELMKEAHREFEREVGRRYTLTQTQLQMLNEATGKNLESCSVYFPVGFDTSNDALVVGELVLAEENMKSITTYEDFPE